MTADLLQAVRDLPKVSPYLHVPAQSGSNAVLKRMKRGYTVEEYREMLEQIRETVPHAAVTSDFIVGFCGETEEDFDRTAASGPRGAVQERFYLQVQPAPGDQERRTATPTTCRRKSNAAGTTICWRYRTQSARSESSVLRPHAGNPRGWAEQVQPQAGCRWSDGAAYRPHESATGS